MTARRLLRRPAGPDELAGARDMPGPPAVQVTALLAACADPAAPVTAGGLAVPGQPVTSPGRPA